MSIWPSGIIAFEQNKVGRDFVVGDIHGHFSKLKLSLEAIGFNPDRDRLFSAGDLVDRGPESIQVMEWLDKPWFHAVCGNHDFMAWRRASGFAYSDVDHRKHGGEWLDDLRLEELNELAIKIGKLPLAIEIETAEGTVGLVHADCTYDNWQEFRSDLRLPQNNDAVPHDCLWSLKRFNAQYQGVVTGVSSIVHGHATIAKPLKLGNTYFIDTGGGDPSGHFTFLDVHAMQFLRGLGGNFRKTSRKFYR